MKKLWLILLLTLCCSSIAMGITAVVKTSDQKNNAEKNIIGIEKTETDDNSDKYEIIYSDGTSYSFIVKNGKDGHTPIITIGENGNWFIDGKDTGIMAEGTTGDQGEQGIQGEKGDKGEQGEQGIQGEKGDKGDQGEQGIQGEKGDKGDQGEQGIQGEKGDKGDQGDPGNDGQNGENGKSAYEIYKEKYGYEGTEEEWLADLANGRLDLKEKHTVIFDTDGGTVIPEQKVVDGKKIVKPENPIKEGYRFTGWYCGEELWSFIGYTVTEDMTLTAKWEKVTIVGDFEIEEENNFTLIKKYIGESGILTIPDEINGKIIKIKYKDKRRCFQK